MTKSAIDVPAGLAVESDGAPLRRDSKMLMGPGGSPGEAENPPKGRLGSRRHGRLGSLRYGLRRALPDREFSNPPSHWLVSEHSSGMEIGWDDSLPKNHATIGSFNFAPLRLGGARRFRARARGHLPTTCSTCEIWGWRTAHRLRRNSRSRRCCAAGSLSKRWRAGVASPSCSRMASERVGARPSCK